MWKSISKTINNEALLLDAHCSFLNNVLLLILKISSEDVMAIVSQLKAEALKWTEKDKNKRGESYGISQGTTKRRATELLGASDQLVRKAVAYTPPPEDDEDEKDKEEERS
ncbi:hypothetical protein C0995_000958 [Termitomyces sp. Mi166|nr:hypothetical protein C0995_000958 [Termitomyces sp. Mi166\